MAQILDRFRSSTLRWLYGTLAGWGTLLLIPLGIVAMQFWASALALLILLGAALAIVLVKWIANLATTSENRSASRSRIRDADYAKETAEMTRTQILQQAGTAMLAQANQVPQNVLNLLK